MLHWAQLRPTPEQYAAFSTHLCVAHSWYKHLPLLTGAEFMVVVAPDAGTGRKVARLQGSSPETVTGYELVTPAEGSEYTTDYPRLHYSWKTTQEYRQRFGYLDYQRRYAPNVPYDRETGPAVRLPAPLAERCTFVLYPYVSWTFSDALTWDVHTEALDQLRAGATHPAREQVLALAPLANAHQLAFQHLQEDERTWLYAYEDADEPLSTPAPSAALQAYIEEAEAINAIATQIRTQEIDKIERALRELDDWLARSV